ncbi:ABC transporter permease [Staphylococcus lugdunensis]|uniref:FtsX-like permease family protein n=1 Tax=Staphylococcus TaxID=1279 RepID=UPI0008A2C9B1|nr:MULTISPECIES: ABC transporter permease [Staphylococcus]ARJ14668.1 ABC transporter permease [Staphylococcus lugdunensis]MCH8665792.1 ABC transporter permease [Staphylococcus lugdunensis]OFJ64958.1 bacitracin ABC transporter permease [Staphylococcus sp. HMSC077E11]OFM42439.1 bacitracin ABC transporter permease [Staphylococcus sp. HMSC077E12]OFR90249.1 bacitracin ABC transporter permease [Staphylococcus sp. HMSC059F04]
MNFNHIILKNFRQNMRHYALYLLSLIISIVLYFSFVTIRYVRHININQSFDVIREGTQFGSYFLFVIILIFIIYSNMLFVKRRFREFALYQVIGLSKRNLVHIVMVEQIAIYFVTSIIGILIGLFSTKILLMIVLKLLGAKATAPIVFSAEALLQTGMLIGSAFILTMVQSIIFIYRYSLTELFEDTEVKALSNSKLSFKEAIFGILGLLMIATSYYFITNHLVDFVHISVLFIICILLLIGPYFFFRSSVSLVLKLLKRFKQGSVNVSDVIFTSSLVYRVRKNAFSLTVMAIISSITVTVLCIAAISRSSLTNEVLLASPYDVTTNQTAAANQLSYMLNQRQIEHDYNYKELIYTHLYKNKLFNSDTARPYYVNVTSAAFFPNRNVEKGEADLIIPDGTIRQYMKHYPHGTTGIGTKKHHINVKLNKVIHDVYFKEDNDLGDPTFILNDSDYQKIKTHAKKKDKIVQYGFDLTHRKDVPKLEMIVNDMNHQLETRSQIVSEVSSITGIVLFVTSFLGITFLIAVGCIIYIRQMDETEDELENYSILRKLGFNQYDMTKGLKLKVTFNFGLPLIIALLHAYFISRGFMDIIGTNNTSPIYIVMTIYSTIYAIFAIITYNHTKRTICHSI